MGSILFGVHMKILRSIEGENFKVCRIAKDYRAGTLILVTINDSGINCGQVGSPLTNYNLFTLEDLDGNITKVGIIVLMNLFQKNELAYVAFPTDEMMTLLRFCTNRDYDFVNNYLKILSLQPQRLRVNTTHFQMRLYAGTILETDIQNVDRYNLLLTKFQLLQGHTILETL